MISVTDHPNLSRSLEKPSDINFPVSLFPPLVLGQGSVLVPAVPGRKSLSNIQHSKLPRQKILWYLVCKFTGARKLLKAIAPLCQTRFIFYSRFVTHPPALHFNIKTFHLFCSNEQSSSDVVSGGRRAGTPSHQTRRSSVQ